MGAENSLIDLLEKIEFPFSDEAKPKRTKGGIKYVVFASLPLDQQKAWAQDDSVFIYPIVKEEPKDTFCIHYHDYQKFYDTWVKSIMATHVE